MEPRRPLIVDRYALCDKIASGGMASVHLGRLLGPVGFARVVAIKRLHSHLAEDPEFVAMFLDEARLSARIHHPNVVPVIDVVAMSGELLLVMEYVRGESLSRLVRANCAAPVSVATSIIIGVLYGLHAAHEAVDERGDSLHLVHRDVSPQNVLVGVDGVARVLDFGVAKAVGRIQTTREGQLKGKLAYMAPEQVQGAASRTTDIYAASVIYWELLTGRRLFAGETEAETLWKVMEQRVEPPSRHTPTIPPALNQIVLRALSREPGKRFATARHLAEALESVGTPANASQVGAWVEGTAEEALSRRASLVTQIESGTAEGVPSFTPSHDPVEDPTEPMAGLHSDNSGLTQLSSSAAAGSARHTLRARITRRTLAVGSILGLVAVSSIVAATWSRNSETVAPMRTVARSLSAGLGAAAPNTTPPTAVSADSRSADTARSTTTGGPPWVRPDKSVSGPAASTAPRPGKPAARPPATPARRSNQYTRM